MVKGDGKGKGDGERMGDDQGKGMEKRRGMVKGRAYLGPCHHSLGVLDPHHCLHTCVSQLCHHWAMSPCHPRMWHGCVIVVSLLGCVTCLSLLHVWSCCPCGSSSLLASLCCPCHVIVQCHHPCLAMLSLCHMLSCV